MRVTVFRTGILGLLLLFSTPAWGFDSMALGGGVANQGIEVGRVAVREAFSPQGMSLWRTGWSGFYELAVNRWHYEGRRDDPTTTINAVSFSPVFTLHRHAGSRNAYWEFGIGAALLTDDLIATRDLASQFLFEDRIGWGYRFNARHELSIKLMHYSNAGIRQPNDGVDMVLVHYIHPF